MSQRLPIPLVLVSGALMGSADAVPGVSGGTIALIVGIYERFIDSLASVMASPWKLRTSEGRKEVWEAFTFLVPLGIGLLAAYYFVTKILVGASEEPGLLRRPDTAPALYAFFFGLVLLSLREPWKRIKAPKLAHYVAAAAGAGAVFIFAGLPYANLEPTTWLLLLSGAGAIAVILLPGVSGSLFLVIIGQYTTVAAAVHDRDLATLVIFLAGIGIGAATFVPFLRWVLHHQHDVTMAALTGMMAGSLRALWPWKSGYDPKVAAMTNQGIGDGIHWVVLAAVAGGATVWLLARLEARVLAADSPPDHNPGADS